jgi:hypothetical protein
MNNELMKLIKSVQPTGRMGNNNEPVWNAEKVYGLMVKAQQQVNSVDLADVVNCSSCKYQMNGTTEPCRSCILFSNHTPK